MRSSKLDRLDEAEAVFREAIPIGDDDLSCAAGAFRGSLALLLAQQGQHDEAQALLEAGEPQVESFPQEHAKFLCKKGHVLPHGRRCRGRPGGVGAGAGDGCGAEGP